MLFGQGSEVAETIISEARKLLSTRDFWQKFTKAHTLCALSRTFENEQPVMVNGNAYAVDLYLHCWKKTGGSGLSRYDGCASAFKSVHLDEIFASDFDLDLLSKALLKEEHSHCCFDRLKIRSRVPPHLIPFLAAYLRIVVRSCPKLGTCNNSDKMKCVETFLNHIETMTSKILMCLSCRAYYPTFLGACGSGEMTWSNFRDFKASSGLEACMILMERESFGSCFLPPDYSSDGYFYSIFDGISRSLIAADLWYNLFRNRRVEGCYEQLKHSLPRDIWLRFQRIIRFFEQYPQFSEEPVKKNVLLLWALIRSKSSLKESVGVRIDPLSTISASTMILTRRLLESFGLIDAEMRAGSEIERALKLFVLAELNLQTITSLTFVLSDGSRLLGSELVDRIKAVKSPQGRAAIMKMSPLEVLIRTSWEHELSFSPEVLAQYYLLCRTKVLDPTKVKLKYSPTPEPQRFIDLIRNLASPEMFQVVTKDFSRYLAIEEMANETLWRLGPEKLGLPTNSDVYSLIKGMVCGDKRFVNASFRHLWRNPASYNHIVILVFDGLGYLFLSWLSDMIPRLSRIVRSENCTAIAASCLPSLTAVNHSALLAAATIPEDYFFVESIDQGIRFGKYLDNPQGKKSLISQDRAILRYAEDGEFVSIHHPDSSYLGRAISSGFKFYTRPDSYVGAISRALRTSHKICVSQVNIFDKFLENYQPRHFSSSIQEYLAFSKEILYNAFNCIDENISPDTCVVLVADHGLGWWRGDKIISPETVAEGIARKIPSGSIGRPAREDSPIEIRRAHQTIAYFIPSVGPRRLASVFAQQSENQSMIVDAISLGSFSDHFHVMRVPHPKPHEPTVVLVSKSQVVSKIHPTKKNLKDGYIVGIHGGLSVQEILVPVMVFDYEDWSRSG